MISNNIAINKDFNAFPSNPIIRCLNQKQFQTLSQIFLTSKVNNIPLIQFLLTLMKEVGELDIELAGSTVAYVKGHGAQVNDLDLRVYLPGHYNQAERHHLSQKFADAFQKMNGTSDFKFFNVEKPEIKNQLLATNFGQEGELSVEILWIQSIGRKHLFTKDAERLKIPHFFLKNPENFCPIAIVTDLADPDQPDRDRAQKVIEVDDIDTVDKRGFGRLLCEVVKGWSVRTPKAETILLKNALCDRKKTAIAPFFAELILHACRHIHSDPHKKVKLVFEAWKSFVKHIGSPEVPLYTHDDIGNALLIIKESLAKEPLSPLHRWILANIGLPSLTPLLELIEKLIGLDAGNPLFIFASHAILRTDDTKVFELFPSMYNLEPLTACLIDPYISQDAKEYFLQNPSAGRWNETLKKKDLELAWKLFNPELNRLYFDWILEASEMNLAKGYSYFLESYSKLLPMARMKLLTYFLSSIMKLPERERLPYNLFPLIAISVLTPELARKSFRNNPEIWKFLISQLESEKQNVSSLLELYNDEEIIKGETPYLYDIFSKYQECLRLGPHVLMLIEYGVSREILSPFLKKLITLPPDSEKKAFWATLIFKLKADRDWVGPQLYRKALLALTEKLEALEKKSKTLLHPPGEESIRFVLSQARYYDEFFKFASVLLRLNLIKDKATQLLVFKFWLLNFDKAPGWEELYFEQAADLGDKELSYGLSLKLMSQEKYKALALKYLESHFTSLEKIPLITYWMRQGAFMACEILLLEQPIPEAQELAEKLLLRIDFTDTSIPMVKKWWKLFTTYPPVQSTYWLAMYRYIAASSSQEHKELSCEFFFNKRLPIDLNFQMVLKLVLEFMIPLKSPLILTEGSKKEFLERYFKAGDSKLQGQIELLFAEALLPHIQSEAMIQRYVGDALPCGLNYLIPYFKTTDEKLFKELVLQFAAAAAKADLFYMLSESKRFPLDICVELIIDRLLGLELFTKEYKKILSHLLEINTAESLNLLIKKCLPAINEENRKEPELIGIWSQFHQKLSLKNILKLHDFFHFFYQTKKGKEVLVKLKEKVQEVSVDTQDIKVLKLCLLFIHRNLSLFEKEECLYKVFANLPFNFTIDQYSELAIYFTNHFLTKLAQEKKVDYILGLAKAVLNKPNINSFKPVENLLFKNHPLFKENHLNQILHFIFNSPIPKDYEKPDNPFFTFNKKLCEIFKFYMFNKNFAYIPEVPDDPGVKKSIYNKNLLKKDISVQYFYLPTNLTDPLKKYFYRTLFHFIEVSLESIDALDPNSLYFMDFALINLIHHSKEIASLNDKAISEEFDKLVVTYTRFLFPNKDFHKVHLQAATSLITDVGGAFLKNPLPTTLELLVYLGLYKPSDNKNLRNKFYVNLNNIIDDLINALQDHESIRYILIQHLLQLTLSYDYHFFGEEQEKRNKIIEKVINAIVSKLVDSGMPLYSVLSTFITRTSHPLEQAGCFAHTLMFQKKIAPYLNDAHPEWNHLNVRLSIFNRQVSTGGYTLENYRIKLSGLHNEILEYYTNKDVPLSCRRGVYILFLDILFYDYEAPAEHKLRCDLSASFLAAAQKLLNSSLPLPTKIDFLNLTMKKGLETHLCDEVLKIQKSLASLGDPKEILEIQNLMLRQKL